ncbi:Histidinol-phosphate aminotransferase [Frigidibacter albus]
MPDQIRPQPGILDIALYEGGAGHVAGLSDAIKLSSNENPFGASEKAKDAFLRSVHKLHRYPNTDHSGLRQAIGEVHGLDPARIICGVGSDEIIHFLCQAYAGPGDEVVFTEHGFLMYRISTMAAGATPVEVRERERVTDVDAVLAACGPRTRLVFIANPNNPTGTMIGLSEIERLADGLPPQAILVLDGAYAEYVAGYDGGAWLATTRPNVVMTRTFSKIYGLGGLRIGWGYGPKPIIDVMNRIRGPFNLSTTQAGGGRGRGTRSGLGGSLPGGQYAAAGVAGRGIGRKRRSVRHLHGELHPCPLCRRGRGRRLRHLAAEPGADCAAGDGLQAAELPAHHRGG